MALKLKGNTAKEMGVVDPNIDDLLEMSKEEVNDSNGIYQVKQLPSEYKTYKNSEQTKITYKSYNWGQMRKLSSSDMTTKQLWEFILNGIETEISLPKLKLTVADFHYIAYLRKANTVGRANFFVDMNCYNVIEETGKICLHKNKFIIKDGKDSEVEFSNMDLEKDQFPIVIETDDFTLEMYPMTVSDAFILMNKNLYTDEIARIAVTIKNMKFDDAYNLLNSDKIDSEIGEEIEKADEKFYHRIKPIKRVCEECKQDLMIVLDSGGTFMRPLCESKDNGRVRVRYGKVGQ
jgi:hypothetical protein